MNVLLERVEWRPNEGRYGMLKCLDSVNRLKNREEKRRIGSNSRPLEDLEESVH